MIKSNKTNYELYNYIEIFSKLGINNINDSTDSKNIKVRELSSFDNCCLFNYLNKVCIQTSYI